MSRPLTGFSVLTFDCYGTLIDWESGIWDAYQPLLAANPGAVIDRAGMLAAHSRHEPAVQSETPDLLYPGVLAETHRRVAEDLGLATDRSLDVEFGLSVPHWPAFPDSADALRRLKRHFRLVILSNIDRASFSASNAKLGVTFDAVYTAEDVGSYKPDPRNFQFMLDHLHTDLGLGSDDVLHTAQSLFHDHVPAQRFGLATAWIDRQRLSRGGEWGATAQVESPPVTDFVFFSLAEMADAVES